MGPFVAGGEHARLDLTLAITVSGTTDFSGNLVDRLLETWFTKSMAATYNTYSPAGAERSAIMAAHISSITAVPASEAGALPGFAIVCSCGDRHSVAFESMAAEYAAKHAAYMAKTGR